MKCGSLHNSSRHSRSRCSSGSKRARKERSARLMLIVMLTLCAALATACAPGRTVLIGDDAPVRIGPETTGRIYTLIDGEWVLSDDPVQLPEGWYAVPPRFVQSEDFDSRGGN